MLAMHCPTALTLQLGRRDDREGPAPGAQAEPVGAVDGLGLADLDEAVIALGVDQGFEPTADMHLDSSKLRRLCPRHLS